MTGSKTLHWVHQRLVQITGRNEPFGGISVIVVGDLHHFPPVGDKRVFMPYTKSNNEHFANFLGPVSSLWENFEYFELTKVMRQKDDADFIHALNNLVAGRMTSENIELLKSREVEENDVPDDAIRLFKCNADVDAYNERRIRQKEGTLVQVNATDSVTGKITEKMKKNKLKSLKSMPRHLTYGLPYTLLLKVGIKYIMTVNVDIEDGLVNGATGTLRYIEFNENTKIPQVLYIEFDENYVGHKAIRKTPKSKHSNQIGGNWVPIVQITREISMSKTAFSQVHRKQFPLTPAEGLTIHKSQGSTYKKVCINVKKPLSRELLYVGSTRATALSSFFIVGNFKAPKAPSNDNETMIEIERLKNEKQMKLSFWPLASKLGIVVGYHNVVSFEKYKKHSENDEWYNRCDVLILMETQTMSSYEPELLDFQLVHRSNKNNSIGTGGILIFAKQHIEIKLLHESLKFSGQQSTKSYHSEIFVFEMPEINIINGYKSPLTPVQTFQNQINDAYCEINSTECKQNILLGDFNFDISQKGSSLNSMLAKFDLVSKLNEPTTKNNTIIDVVFADFPHIIAGAYESYFSDHKPICCMMHNKNLTQENLQNFNCTNSKLKRKSQAEHDKSQPITKKAKMNDNNTNDVIIGPSNIQISPADARFAVGMSQNTNSPNNVIVVSSDIQSHKSAYIFTLFIQITFDYQFYKI